VTDTTAWLPGAFDPWLLPKRVRSMTANRIAGAGNRFNAHPEIKGYEEAFWLLSGAGVGAVRASVAGFHR
jgi:hypothetical protein